jgi:Flp pilus assembly CpaE family ATPase
MQNIKEVKLHDKKPVTVKEKFDRLNKKNPNLKKLAEAFGLELEL